MPQPQGPQDAEPSPLPEQADPVPRPLRVSCHAMDLRQVTFPVMVGHYENDPIAAAEALIDRDLVAGELSARYRLGLYAGPLGSATVVLMPDERKGRRGPGRGAVVIGLGSLGELSTITLTEAVRVGVLRFLLHLVDRADGATEPAREVGLASLLIGQNSTNDIHIDDAVTAVVEGVLAANDQLAKTLVAAAPRVSQLQLVEVYLDSAITATRALISLEAKLNRGGGGLLAIDRELRFGPGWRHRLDAAQDVGYWPRLVVTNGETATAEAPEEKGGRRPGARLANQLRFSFLGQRARAETLQQQRQSGLVEALVEASIQTSTFNPDLSLTLFQLLVPSAFKEVARHLEQLVLVLDETTANLPWELLMADDKPLALRLAVVRQLQAPRFRQQPRQTSSRVACVIGNPGSEGFYTQFVGEGIGGSTGLSSLDGAREEAERVLTLLDQHGYTCEPSIEEENGVDIINKLYRHPYRLLHIAGHGVFEHRTRQGEHRTGVVLSGGLLITAAEIEAMEVVPELVFLNCCHLGTVKNEPVAFNRLAASVAGQLIEMGVRAVVACGWAVDDQPAMAFADSFYREMLNGTPFGAAVFLARKEAETTKPASNTWGAYQAYGDPSYQLEAPQSGASAGLGAAAIVTRGWSLVTPLELIDRLQQLEAHVQHGVRQAESADPLLVELRDLLAATPASWLDQADVAVAVADIHRAFGGPLLEEACHHYRAALRGQRGTDGPPLRAIARLADLEARLGERNGDERRVLAAIDRLRALIRGASDGSAPRLDASLAEGPAVWQALLGSAQKRLAALRSRALLASNLTGQDALQGVLEPLEASIAAYGLAGEASGQQLRRLALEAVRGLDTPADPGATRQAKALQEEQRSHASTEGVFGSAVALADALLVRHLVDRRLAADDAAGERAAHQVEEAYQDVFATLRGTPHDRQCVWEELSLLGDLALACGRRQSDPGPAHATLAQRLKAIGEALRSWDAAQAPQPEEPAASEEAGEEIERLS